MARGPQLASDPEVPKGRFGNSEAKSSKVACVQLRRVVPLFLELSIRVFHSKHLIHEPAPLRTYGFVLELALDVNIPA